MKLTILQLTDIHLQPTRKFAVNRIGHIARAVCAGDLDWTNLLIVLGGDIAFSGAKNEYAIALGFVNDLTSLLKQAKPESIIHLVAVPGNHDCDYTPAGNQIRRMILGHLRANPKEVIPDTEPLKSLLSVQENFEGFKNAILTVPVDESDTSRIARTVDLSFGDDHIRVNLLNTAFACDRYPSKSETDQGKLFLPLRLMSQGAFSSADTYAITVMHHPLNWLESNNALEVERVISGSSDLILTGHQHQEEAQSRDCITKEKNLWVSGSALQEETGSASGFNLLTIDTHLLDEAVYQYRWNGNLYARTGEQSWRKTEEQRTNRRQIPLTSQARTELEDPGTGFTHPSKKPLRLEDLFVYPRLALLFGASEIKEDEGVSQDSSGKPPDFRANKVTLVIGEPRSGKTTLAKVIFKTVYDSKDNVTPLRVEGGDFTASHATSDRPWKVIEKAFKQTYSAEAFDAYTQLVPASRFLIVDNWQDSELNDSGRVELLGFLNRKFACVVLMTDETVKIEKTGIYSETMADGATCAAYKIQPFGHLMRSKLIRKWLTFSRENSITSKSLHDETYRAEVIINTVLGKSLMPSYPIFVFSLLQVDQNVNTANHANGSYGYLYESLITMALAEVSKQSTEIDVYYMILGRMAWALYKLTADSLGVSETKKLIVGYADEYKALVDPMEIINKLLRAKLVVFADGAYSFRYKYIYCFFVARFLADCLKTPESIQESRKAIVGLADNITREDNANIVIFLIYFTRDSELIERLLSNARRLFASSELFDADKSLAFLAPAIERYVKTDRVVVVNSPEANRDAERGQLDRVAASDDGHREDDVDGVGPNSDFAKAIKLMDILGQTVRNFPGSMPGGLKVRVTSDVYRLGLRLITATISTIESDIEKFRGFIKKGIVSSERLSKGRDWTEEELEKKADQLMVMVILMITFGVVKTITSAVGLGQLRPTYDEVKSKLNNTPAVNLIDLSIALDHGAEFPKSQILGLNEAFRDKWFGRMMLRRLAAYHFMMFHVERTTARSVGDKLGLNMQMAEITSKTALLKVKTS